MRSFKKRLLSLIVLLVVVAQGVTMVLAYVTLRQNVGSESAQALREASTQIQRRLEARTRQLRVSAELVVRDYGFRQTVVTGDTPTIVSALRNQAQRADADIALLYSNEGVLQAATLDARETPVPPPPSDDATDGAPIYAVIRGRAYQLVFSQVTAPQPVGWVALGLALDRPLVTEMNKVVNAEVSVVASDPDGERRTISSTLPADAVRSLLTEQPPGRFDQPREATLQGESFLTLMTVLPASGGHIELLVQRSLNLALAPLRHMWGELLLICCGILSAALVAGMMAGNRALRPLATLVEMARQVADGNYRQRANFKGDAEFQQLATTFDTMQAAIEQREARIFVQATQDSLTGFSNRKAFRQTLDELLASSPAHLTVAVLDVLRFRDINASVGHHMGDELLRELARRLQALVGNAAHCARVNADVYALVMPLADNEVQQRIAALAEDWRRGVPVENLQLNVELRCGVAESRNRVNGEDLLRQAGVALVEAKSRRSGIVLYQPGHDAELNRRVTLVAELRRAIVEDSLTLAYQPLVSLTTRETVMLEALVRWSHPTLGEISPAEFVPLAERAAVVADLSRWVMTASIRQLGQWRRAGQNVSVAVNLSAADMGDPMLPLRVLTLLQEHDVPPTHLLLEVTESTIMREPAQAAQFMDRLRLAGLRFAIDDFGTGYSSLASLHSLPVDELKLDRAFILDLDRSVTNQAIVRAVIALAHSMKLKVVAEGVETPEVWTMLAQLGCDIAQGYYISRPMTVDKVPAWVRAQNALVIPVAVEPSTVAPFRPRALDRPG